MWRRLTHNTQLQIQGPDMLSLWKGGPYIKSFSLATTRLAKATTETPLNTQVHSVEYSESDEFEDVYIKKHTDKQCKRTEQ